MRIAKLPRVLIVGGGFGGIAAARALKGAPAHVTLVDAQNHHVFQPLLYQVATASLSPADISAPIRATLRGNADCDVVLAKVTSVDVEQRRLLVETGAATFDYLVLAAGARHDYFGQDHWADLAPGLKTLSDATEVRRRMLLAFESAELEGDRESRQAALTFAIVGGGPTGVELAGAIKEIAGKTLPKEYKNIDTTTARVILLEGAPRLLGAFPEQLSQQAKVDLERLGVEVRLNSIVTNVTSDGLSVGEEFIPAQNVFWAAGVKANPLTESLGVPLDRVGRVLVEPDLSIPGQPKIFVIGDMASVIPPNATEPVPGVAQAAMQMGRYVGDMIRQETAGLSKPADRQPFEYYDKGSMAIIGKNHAVAAIGQHEFTGFFAWLLWAVVHIAFLVGFRNRIRVMFNWATNWLLSNRDARLIIGDTQLRITRPHGRGFTPKPDGDVLTESPL